MGATGGVKWSLRETNPENESLRKTEAVRSQERSAGNLGGALASLDEATIPQPVVVHHASLNCASTWEHFQSHMLILGTTGAKHPPTMRFKNHTSRVFQCLFPTVGRG